MVKSTVKSTTSTDIEIVALSQGSVKVAVIGYTPLVYNAVSEKNRRQILNPTPKSRAERAVTLKHNPPQEYRDSVYRRRDAEEGPTRLVVPAEMFKAAMTDVSKIMPGAPPSTRLRQLLWVKEPLIDVYGIPQLYMAVVRNSDINRTPDIRTRAIVPEWCCSFTINYSTPLLSADTVLRLLNAAGQLNGIGDRRQQKGGGNGQWEAANTSDKAYKHLVAHCGRTMQDAALASPAYYDYMTETMMAWFDDQMAKRDPANRPEGVDMTELVDAAEDELQAAE